MNNFHVPDAFITHFYLLKTTPASIGPMDFAWMSPFLNHLAKRPLSPG